MYQEVFKLHSQLLKALSHPKRLEIIHLLRDQELSVTEILAMLDLPQANLSQHLTILREAQVVKFKKDGKQVYYSLAHQNFIQASDLLREVLIERHKNDPLSDELAQKMTDLIPIVHDPVCQMRLSPKTASYAHQLKGSKYYFCAEGCYKTFIKHPSRYLTKEQS